MSPSALPNLYHRAPFLLKDLTVDIRVWSGDRDDLVSFLHLTPSLEVLRIQLWGFNPFYFDPFTYLPDNPPPIVLRKLHYLAFHVDCIVDPMDLVLHCCPLAAEMAESFEEYPGELNDAFPSLADVAFFLAGKPFYQEIEDRLVEASESGGVFSYTRSVYQT
ncbi:hypothetical protein FB45DRAFT_1105929 [Roridomyces roridus]|uniref:Uncharacterized protein n=1 Tax=Roridomyces roridus TaxID=1738132 RepID=A0AAD7BBV3_9AGAR|nr:hypothetical protein FB45DRAFT_1105929 [Roridomyces roridus]